MHAGIETCIMETYSRFDKEKWDVTIHTSASTLDTINTLPHKANFDGLAVVRYKTIAGLFIPEVPWTRECIIVICNFSLIPILPILATATFFKVIGLKKAKLVFAPHGGFTPMWEVFPPIQKVIKLFLHRFFGRHMINHTVSWLHSVAEWEKRKLIPEGVDEKLISVIPNGVERAGFIKDLAPDAKTKKLIADAGKYLVTVGRIHPIKNLHTAIKALEFLPSDVKLLILGQVENKEYEQLLYDLVKEKKLEGRVIFGGILRGEDKFYAIRHAIAMVHPSLYEVDPLVVKEAISQGTICIGAANTGTKYLIKDGKNGFLVPTDDYKKIAERVKFIQEHPKDPSIIAIKENDMEEREDYNWDTIAKKIETKFLQLLGEKTL